MMKPRPAIFLLVPIFFGVIILLAADAPSEAPQTFERSYVPSYHEHPPIEPLPPTLDPAEFSGNSRAFVAYQLASRIAPTLYQEPCYCGCDKEQKHTSLLDCFTGTHGALCRTCQQEAIFCYLQYNKGKNPLQIRRALAKGKFRKLDLEKYVEQFSAHPKWEQ